jgi:hypothetical protein
MPVKADKTLVPSAVPDDATSSYFFGAAITARRD